MSHSRSSSDTDEGSESSSQSKSDYLEFTNSEGGGSSSKRNFPRARDSSIVVNEDPLWCTEYAGDILSYLRRIEGTRKAIMYKSPQISHRAGLIALIKRIAEAEELGRTTVHLAVYMLDVFMDTYKIIETKLNLVALVCLLIAAKVEERDQNIPKICVLSSYAGETKYSRNDFKVLERMVLGFFKWNLLPPTTATFLESFAHQTASYAELRNLKYSDELFEESERESQSKSVRELDSICYNLVFEFLDITLNDRRLVHVKPSRLSAACLAAARKVCDINPIWPERLKLLTNCTFDLIDEYVEALICLRDSLYERNVDEIKKTPDSGYITDSESDSSDDDDDFTHCPIPFKRQRLTY